MEKKTIVVASRESRLAVVQSQMVLDYLAKHAPQVTARLLTMKTTGDKILDRRLDEVGGKGLFVKELDKALLERKSDVSVHSLKDMPMEVPPELPLLGFSRREDPRDALVLPLGATELDPDRPIGCSSLRRTLQLRELFPDGRVESVRGNVQTRLKKLDEGQYGALVLAAAGLRRLGLAGRISRCFTTQEMLPAAGQGILVLQGRRGEDYHELDGFFDPDSLWMATAERAFVRELDGGCTSPVAAHARVESGTLYLTGLYYDEGTGQYRKGSTEGKTGNIADLEALGTSLARTLRGW